ncbi:MAG: helix-turn-helix domain-containing protein [Phycisphaerales bacterium]|nr:helix-turn-helix domain-containing protein [Phycisphaerales bacterium]
MNQHNTFQSLNQQQQSKPELISVRPAQAAEMIGVSERTLRELLRQGEIPHAKLDRAVLILVSDLRAFIERKTQHEGGEA